MLVFLYRPIFYDSADSAHQLIYTHSLSCILAS